MMLKHDYFFNIKNKFISYMLGRDLMGCDITLFCEGYINNKWINIDRWYRRDGWADYMVTENEGFGYTDLINGYRDYGLFYLLAGIRGNDNEESYSPIARAKGLPGNMDSLIKKYYENFYEINFENENINFHHPSYLTLREIKDSGYADVMPLQGWVEEHEFNKAVDLIKNGQEYQLHFVDKKSKVIQHQGMVLREWDGYLNLNLTHMKKQMEQLIKERGIENDDEIRIVFWFDN